MKNDAAKMLAISLLHADSKVKVVEILSDAGY